jgi:hypothetical protein
VGDEPDRWAPPVGEREREERGGSVDGPAWADSGAGPRGWVRIWFCCFFLFLFKSIFKPFKFKSFTCFQTQFLTQIYSNILRLLENLLNNFSNIKFKLSSFF